MGWLDKSKWQKRTHAYQQALEKRERQALREEWRQNERTSRRLSHIADHSSESPTNVFSNEEINRMVALYENHKDGGLFEDEYRGWLQMRDERHIAQARSDYFESDKTPSEGNLICGADWKPYQEYLLNSQQKLPLAPQSMLALSVASTEALHQGLMANRVLPSLAACVQIQFRCANEERKPSISPPRHAYDRDATFVILIDRPRLYQTLLGLDAMTAQKAHNRLWDEINRGAFERVDYIHGSSYGFIDTVARHCMRTNCGNIGLGINTKGDIRALHSNEEFVDALDHGDLDEVGGMYGCKFSLKHYNNPFANMHRFIEGIEAYYNTNVPNSRLNLARFKDELAEDKLRFRQEQMKELAEPNHVDRLDNATACGRSRG